jgi:enhancing lycopene biosynthesis protein 2
MSLDYARDHLVDAVRSLAAGDDPPAVRLQAAWSGPVGMVWEKPCLTVDLLRDFRDMWHRYTAPSDDRTSTALRELGPDEVAAAVDEIVALLVGTAVAAAQAGDGVRLATLADLA